MNYLDQILEFWLPTKPSRLIAGLSTTLGAGAFLLPEFLNTLCIRLPDHLTLLVRIATPLLIWLLGSLFVLHAVVQYSKSIKAQEKPPLTTPIPVAQPIQLPKEQINILKFLFKQNKLPIEQIAQALGYEIQVATFHLQELKINNMVSCAPSHFRNEPPSWKWSLAQEGRRYLIENKLIS